MRVIVVGLGVQGRKRAALAGADVVATIDPNVADADFRDIADVPSESYQAALVCTSEDSKFTLLRDLLKRGKHVLVEKPLLSSAAGNLKVLREAVKGSGTVCYTAYNHRFEPHFVRMKEVLDSGVLGRIYRIRLFYGNGTARLVRGSAWRDQGAGVLTDLGSHLLDTVRFWCGEVASPFRVVSADRFENQAPDHVVLACNGPPSIELEMTFLSWRNHFTADVIAEHGSAHISSLCKWGPSIFTLRDRILPSGRPHEESVTLARRDPTWESEYKYFVRLCENGGPGETSIGNDLWLDEVLGQLASQLPDPAR